MPAPFVVPASPYAVYSSVRVAGSHLPGLRLRDVLGGEFNVGFKDNVLNRQLAQARTGNIATIAGYLDQSGNGRHALQPTTAAQGNYSPTMMRRGIQPFTADSTEATQPPISAQERGALVTGLGIARQSFSAFVVVSAVQSQQAGQFLEAANVAGDFSFNLFNNAYPATADGSAGLCAAISDGTFSFINDPALSPAAQPVVMGISSSASDFKIWLNGVSASNGGPADAATVDQLWWCLSSNGDVLYDGRADFWASGIYDRELVAADWTALQAAANRSFPMPVSTHAVLVLDGDSRATAYGSTGNQTWMRDAESRLPLNRRPLIYNNAVNGKPVGTVDGIANAAWFPIYSNPRFVSGAKNIYMLQGGLNDTPDGAFYTSTVGPFLNGIKAAGRTVIACTITPTNGGALYTSYNTALRAALGTDYDVLCDFDANPILASNALIANGISLDGSHYNNLGQSIMAPIAAQAIYQAMAL